MQLKETVVRFFAALGLLICTIFFSSKSFAQGPSWEDVIYDANLIDAHQNGLDVMVPEPSVALGQRPSILVRSPVPFQARIYHLGWHGGRGAKLIANLTNQSARNHLPAQKCGRQSPDPVIAQQDLDFGLIECKWHSPLKFRLPPLIHGLFFVRITAFINGADREASAMFVIRDDSSTGHLLLLNPTTGQVYNEWSDTPSVSSSTGFLKLSMYTSPRASKVSFNRPVSYTSKYLKEVYPLIRFLDRKGIPYSLATDFDIHANPQLLANRQSIVLAGHAEYWSWGTRSALDTAVEVGQNLIAMSANAGYWQVRYESSALGAGAGPVIMSHKDLALPGGICSGASGPYIYVPNLSSGCADPILSDGNPLNDYLSTTYFRSAPVNHPEQLLLGVQYQLNPASNGHELPLTLYGSQLSIMPSLGAGLSLTGTTIFGVATQPNFLEGNIGYEFDVIHPHVLLDMLPEACLKVFGDSRWDDRLPSPPLGQEAGNYTGHLVLYRPSLSSGHVVSGLSMLWSWGVDSWATLRQLGGPAISRVHPQLERLTENMLAASINNSFGTDCSSPLNLSFAFAQNLSPHPGAELLIHENEYRGRFSIVETTSSTGPSIKLNRNPFATADLVDWAPLAAGYSHFIGDVDGDGDSDIVAKADLGDWYVARNQGGFFVPDAQPWLSGWAVATGAYDLFLADVDANGQADLIAKEKNLPGNWYVAKSNGNSFVPQSNIWMSFWAQLSGLFTLRVADVNGDGRADIIAKENLLPGQVYVALSTGSQFIPQPVWVSGWAMDSSLYDFYTGDVNGDALGDLIAKEKGLPGNWFVALSNGAQFVPQTTPWLTGWAMVSSAYELFVADLGGDGRADLVAREKGSGRWYLASSNGASFIPQTGLLY